MNTIERLLHTLSRFVFGLGVGLALTSAYVIVCSAPALTGRGAGRPEVVRLDPVVVTISRERFEAIYTEAHPPAPLAQAPAIHLYGRGPQPV